MSKAEERSEAPAWLLMGTDEAQLGTAFWVSNFLFFITGPVMVMVNQQLGMLPCLGRPRPSLSDCADRQPPLRAQYTGEERTQRPSLGDFISTAAS